MEPTHTSKEESSEELDFLSILSPIGKDLNAVNDYVPVFDMLNTFAYSLLGETMDLHHLAVAQRMESEFFSRSEIISAFNLSNRFNGSMPEPYGDYLEAHEGETLEEYTARFQLAPDDLILASPVRANSLHNHFSAIRNNRTDYLTNMEIRLTVLRKSIFSLPAVTHLESEEEDDFI